MKICFKCKDEKPYSSFNKDKTRDDGYTHRYKICIKECKDPIKVKEYYQKNKEIILLKVKEYDKKNYQKTKQKRIKYTINYIRNKRHNDPLFKMSDIIRSSIFQCFKRSLNGSVSKTKLTKDILCCSFLEFKLYIESQFESWMTWNNHGLYNGEPNYGWDLDHIIPISSAKTEEDIYKLNHYTNFQPLCSYINRNVKKDKLNYNNEKI